MIASKGGHVVNIASLAGHAGTNKLVGCFIRIIITTIIIKIIIIVVRRLTIAQASLLLLVWTRLSGLSWPCRSTHNCHSNLAFSTKTMLRWHLSFFSNRLTTGSQRLHQDDCCVSLLHLDGHVFWSLRNNIFYESRLSLRKVSSRSWFHFPHGRARSSQSWSLSMSRTRQWLVLWRTGFFLWFAATITRVVVLLVVIRSSYFLILAEKSLGDVGGVPLWQTVVCIQLADDQYVVVKSCCCLLLVTTSHPTNPQGDCPPALVVHAPTDTQGELVDS